MDKRYIELEDLKKIELDILKHFQQYCEKENLRFYLSYGTLIGAIRHHGFIPWDDDIDVMMPRADYDKFMKNYTDPTGTYSFVSYETDHRYYLPFGKLMDNRTVVDEHFKSNFLLGAYVDIFPMDGYSKKNKYLIRKNRVLRFFSWAHDLTYKKHALKENIQTFFCHLISFWTSTPKAMKKMIKNARKLDDYETAEYSVILSGSLGNAPMKKEGLKVIQVPFEDTMMPCPSGYDEILTDWYGDYMTPPPPEKQTTMHTGHSVWWKDGEGLEK